MLALKDSWRKCPRDPDSPRRWVYDSAVLEASSPGESRWSRVRTLCLWEPCVAVGDFVPPLLQTHLLSRLPIPDSQVITINPQLPVEEAAEDYAKKLRQVSPTVWPQGGLVHAVVTEQACGWHCMIITSKN